MKVRTGVRVKYTVGQRCSVGEGDKVANRERKDVSEEADHDPSDVLAIDGDVEVDLLGHGDGGRWCSCGSGGSSGCLLKGYRIIVIQINEGCDCGLNF